MSSWHDHIGRETGAKARLDSDLVARFAATLGDAGVAVDPAALPLGIHWCVGVETVPTLALGPDGHPPKGGFLPPVPLPRRMWAGGSLELLRPLAVGQEIERRSTIADVSEKAGKSGALVFVTVAHEIWAEGHPAIRERQDIVYRSADPTAPPPAGLPDAEAPAAGGDRILPDSRLLFRYSALTFNSHRIHYDLPYARDEENYPALVVHGPLQATLLAARAAVALGRPLHSFRYRGQAPAFAGRPLSFVAEPDAGGGVTVTSRQFGKICMQAQAT
ncbi:FAS1-like dehydratase domain-containing protein [Azospirillum isscasi]|uniref:MaoC family dehydratase N-terminal domain-containing protein n=1 Tax=Azospirillum isscasi TaxID=3053926 RepID=A0ABU0WFP8_9PROT|nr:MaoC family dehydratase N-terminal domain-containing protein [Azospirillum isscasi]MDQ2103026.1 MaoC family dehydratase N-terminal domain-containing protein [Azospirillum isscasi]